MIYEWRCVNCDKTWVEARPAAECFDPSFCPQCGNDGTKTLHAHGVIFKCGGFPGQDNKGALVRKEIKEHNRKTFKESRRAANASPLKKMQYEWNHDTNKGQNA
eukprot:GHVO01058375.1.p2 GENE.GHVO01058375.1~~GHVO01058375.1.p2  ORF type:complete len:104 (+),score=2.85 GHVO01058375.1:84-395(+)